MLTRRTLLASSAATLAAPAIIPPARDATPKGVAVMAKAIDDIVSFDPAESYEFTNGEVDANCYRRLIRPNLEDTTKIDGDLAEKWEVSKDGLTFTFHMRRDALFESGKPVTAHDAAFSLQRVVKLNKTPGFIVTQFGRIPATGDHFDWAGWRFEVMDMDRHRVDKVIVSRPPSPATIQKAAG